MHLDDILNDHTSGAEALLKNAGLWLQQEARSFLVTENPATLTALLRQCGLDLVRAQPRMAPMLNLVNAVLNICDVDPDPNAICSAIDNMLNTVTSAKSAMRQYLSSLLTSDVTTIATISRSSAVMDVLLKLTKSHNIRVLVLESRPVMEGRTAAQRLAEVGIPVTLLVDAAMSTAVERADLVLTGADAFDDQQFINKIGTLPLALLCREFNTPLYVMTTAVKYLPDLSILPPEADKPAGQVWEHAPIELNINIDNRYFETVSLALATGVITGRGVWRPGDGMFDTGYCKNLWLWDELDNL